VKSKGIRSVIPASHDFAEQNHHLAGIYFPLPVIPTRFESEPKVFLTGLIPRNAGYAGFYSGSRKL
jgi:hypothetical protein